MGVSFQKLCLLLFVVVSLSGGAHAFGAGNIASISKIEGQNWRHGDIEDALLGLFLARAAGGRKFSKLDVQRVYFGNWLRDYSQAVDVGTVKYVSAEAIRILLWVLGFLSFGYEYYHVSKDFTECLDMVRRSSKSQPSVWGAISPLNILIILLVTLKAKTPATMTGASGARLMRSVNWLLILRQVSCIFYFSEFS
jgi:hypothetical protein